MPWFLKYSAMAVAASAPRARTSGGWSLVAVTTTERARPCGPRAFLMKSLSSRPRSPISATTLTSAWDERQIMPSRVLLPTPAPAKMPMRCPTPSGSMPSTARIPVAKGCSMARRANGGGGAA